MFCQFTRRTLLVLALFLTLQPIRAIEQEIRLNEFKRARANKFVCVYVQYILNVRSNHIYDNHTEAIRKKSEQVYRRS